MSIRADEVKPRAVFRFRYGDRRVIEVRGWSVGVGQMHADVVWEYADGKERQGIKGGRCALSTFCQHATRREDWKR